MKGKNGAAWKSAFASAFPHTVPVMAGFLFLGMTYGILARASGLNALFPIIMSVMVYAGSAEFLMVELLQGAFAPLSVFGLILMLNARHLFYGISMLEKYRDAGRKKWYLIFGMSDETFSLLYTVDAPEGRDKGRFMLAVTVLNQSYWVMGACMGALLGSVLTFNTEGLDFVMTAMFVCIFLNQWDKKEQRRALLIGLIASALMLVLMGPDRFLLPAMGLILLILTGSWKKTDGEAAA